MCSSIHYRGIPRKSILMGDGGWKGVVGVGLKVKFYEYVFNERPNAVPD